jgi:hypothetical protein
MVLKGFHIAYKVTKGVAKGGHAVYKATSTAGPALGAAVALHSIKAQSKEYCKFLNSFKYIYR